MTVYCTSTEKILGKTSCPNLILNYLKLRTWKVRYVYLLSEMLIYLSKQGKFATNSPILPSFSLVTWYEAERLPGEDTLSRTNTSFGSFHRLEAVHSPSMQKSATSGTPTRNLSICTGWSKKQSHACNIVTRKDHHLIQTPFNGKFHCRDLE